jgi:hypothetical protein
LVSIVCLFVVDTTISDRIQTIHIQDSTGEEVLSIWSDVHPAIRVEVDLKRERGRERERRERGERERGRERERERTERGRERERGLAETGRQRRVVSVNIQERRVMKERGPEG